MPGRKNCLLPPAAGATHKITIGSPRAAIAQQQRHTLRGHNIRVSKQGATSPTQAFLSLSACKVYQPDRGKINQLFRFLPPIL